MKQDWSCADNCSSWVMNKHGSSLMYFLCLYIKLKFSIIKSKTCATQKYVYRHPTKKISKAYNTVPKRLKKKKIELLVRQAFFQKGTKGIWSSTGLTHFIELCLLCFTDTTFYKLKVCGNPSSNKSTSTNINWMSLCHIFVILTICQTFSLLLYLLWWSVISEWSLMSLLQKVYNSLKAQMRAFF